MPPTAPTPNPNNWNYYKTRGAVIGILCLILGALVFATISHTLLKPKTKGLPNNEATNQTGNSSDNQQTSLPQNETSPTPNSESNNPPSTNPTQASTSTIPRDTTAPDVLSETNPSTSSSSSTPPRESAAGSSQVMEDETSPSRPPSIPRDPSGGLDVSL